MLQQADVDVHRGDFVVRVTMGPEIHSLAEVQSVVDAVWGIYAGALLATLGYEVDYQWARVWLAIEDWYGKDRTIAFLKIPRPYPYSVDVVRAIDSGASERRASRWYGAYAQVSRLLRQVAEGGGVPDMSAGAKVQRLEQRSPLVLEVLFAAASVPVAAMMVVRGTAAAVISIREASQAAEFRARERDIALNIREAVEKEIRANGVNSVDPGVVAAAMLTQAVPANDLLSTSVKDIAMTLVGKPAK